MPICRAVPAGIGALKKIQTCAPTPDRETSSPAGTSARGQPSGRPRHRASPSARRNRRPATSSGHRPAAGTARSRFLRTGVPRRRHRSAAGSRGVRHPCASRREPRASSRTCRSAGSPTGPRTRPGVRRTTFDRRRASSPGRTGCRLGPAARRKCRSAQVPAAERHPGADQAAAATGRSRPEAGPTRRTAQPRRSRRDRLAHSIRRARQPRYPSESH